jgi:pyruvate dehydrogenase E1 component
VTRALGKGGGPVVAVSDFMMSLPDMVSRWIPGEFTALGTDGFGRSDTREALRRFFEVDAEHVAAATLALLARQGKVEPGVAAGALAELGLDPEAPDPALP